MKIAITGAQGVGKTTLAQQINNEYPELEILPEAARLAQKEGYKLDSSATVETEIWLINKQLELESLGDSWVADRCTIDLFAYLKHLFSHENELVKFAKKMLIPKFNSYDLVIYLPSGEFAIEDDGVRETNLKFQKDIDSYIVNILNEHEIKYLKITGTREERLEKVKKILNF